MRDLDKHSQHGALGPPIRPKAEPPPLPTDTWVPVGKDHERNERTGDVRLRPGRA